MEDIWSVIGLTLGFFVVTVVVVGAIVYGLYRYFSQEEGNATSQERENRQL